MPRPIFFLTVILAITDTIVAGAGLFWPKTGGPRVVTSIHGVDVTLFGRGIYANDSAFVAPILMGSDAMVLFMALPLLGVVGWRWHCGSVRAAYLFAGVLAVLSYHAASLALGAAFNRLFLLYVIAFSAGVYSLILTLVHLAGRGDRFSDVPRRAVTGFLLLAGAGLLVWLTDAIPAAISGTAPALLGTSSTAVTHALDLGLLAPASFAAAWMVWTGRSFGVVLAVVLLVANALVGVMVILQTLVQRAYGVAVSTGDLLIFVGVFVALCLLACAVLWRLIQSIPPR